MCHLGRPKNNESKFKTNNIANRISELLDEKIEKVDNWETNNSKIVFLENLRFNPAEKDKDIEKRDIFGKELSLLADIFVQDAFSNCHHDQASMTSVTKFIPSICLAYFLTSGIFFATFTPPPLPLPPACI